MTKASVESKLDYKVGTTLGMIHMDLLKQK